MQETRKGVTGVSKVQANTEPALTSSARVSVAMTYFPTHARSNAEIAPSFLGGGSHRTHTPEAVFHVAQESQPRVTIGVLSRPVVIDENPEIAHRRIVAGRGTLRNYGRNNNSPETGKTHSGRGRLGLETFCW